MGRLLQGAALLLLLATLARADDGYRMFNKQSKVKLSDLMNKDVLNDLKIAEDKFFFLEGLLAAKTCFRDWVNDDECTLHIYTDAIYAAKGNEALLRQAQEDHPKGFDNYERVYDQVKNMKEIYNKNKIGHFRMVLEALQKNFVEMVELQNEEASTLAALKKHLESDELADMITAIEQELKEAIGTTEPNLKHHLIQQTIENWIADEKTKFTEGRLGKILEVKDWDKINNKMPDTLKYNTRGATPVAKEHLQKKFREGFKGNEELKKKYDTLKQKSAAYLQVVANRMRHEAMKKSNSLIAIVMHSVEMGQSHMDMDLSNEGVKTFLKKHGKPHDKAVEMGQSDMDMDLSNDDKPHDKAH